MGLLLAIGAVTVVATAIQMRGRVLPSTYVGATDVSLATPQDLEQLTREVIAQYQSREIAIELDWSKAGSFLPAELGIALDPIATSQKVREGRIIDSVSPQSLWSVVTTPIDHVVEPVFTIDQTRAAAVFAKLTGSRVREPVDARLNVTDGVVVISPSQSGYNFGQTVFTQMLGRHAGSMSTAPITLQGVESMPTVVEADLAQAANTLGKLLTGGLTLTAGSAGYEVSPGELGSWIVPGDPALGQSGFTWNDDLIRKKIRGIAREQDQASTPTKVIGNTDAVVEQGQRGLVVDQEGAYSAVVVALTSGLAERSVVLPTAVTEPEKIAVAAAAAPSSNLGKSIRVVLSEQRLYAWEDGQLVKSFLVSTGLTGPTPVGNWAVHNKTYVQTYRGPGYDLPNVHYSSWFLPEIAIHEAYWHNNFGQPMSHGCVNARIEDAQFIYEWAPIGTPVEVVS
ncbi:MAG: L,D-transpeptidase family protein [bacterium]|nr:L,D-transpeptidase family protein [bacterium]